MSKILVTGGAGFIGSHLVDALVAAGHTVTILDNFSSGTRVNVANVSDRVQMINADIRDWRAWTNSVGDVECIVHLAALISGYDSLFDPDQYDDVNVRGFLKIIEFARDHRVPRIVFASSSTVYGNQNVTSLGETSPVDPQTVYALTKLVGEKLLRIYGMLHGFSHCSLRLFNVYGPRQAIDHPYANVTCKFSHAAAHGLRVRRYGDGEQARDFVYVDDVVRAFLAVLETSEQTVYNIGTGRRATINQLIEILGRISDGPLNVEQCEPWPNDIRAIRADSSRFVEEFGFGPDVQLAEGLQRTVDFFRALDA